MSGDGHQVSAHKLILAANSQLFRGILKRNPHVCPLIYLRDVKHSDLLLLLGFMYTGEVTVGQKELGSFLKAGEDLGVKGLGERARDSGLEEVKAGAHKPRQRKVVPEVPLEVAMVKTETGSLEAGEEEGAGDDQNLPDDDNNRLPQDLEKGEGSGQEVAEGGVITNPTIDQRKKVLDQHMKSIRKDGRSAWQCCVCGNTFSVKTRLRRHIEAFHVHQVFQYNCRFCSKVFNSLSKLENHEGRVHTLGVI